MKKLPDDIISLIEKTNPVPTEQGFHAPESCSRCGGLMVTTDCLDVLSDSDEINCRVSRCIQCGDLVDPVILRNRLHPPSMTPRKKNLKWTSRRSVPLVHTLMP